MSVNHQQVQTAYGSLPDKVRQMSIDSGIILGSGLGTLIDNFAIITSIPYANIKGFPTSTAPTHQGQLIIAKHQGTILAIFQGRFHLYEGWSAEQVALPIYLLKKMRAQRVIITNAAGALNPDIPIASVMLIQDHINLTGHNPLIGINDSGLGVRFPDMSKAYDLTLQQLALQCATDLKLNLKQGIYTGITGPSFETSAERRYLHHCGGDAVGMSTIMEVIAANHCNLPVLGFSVITNGATGLDDQQPDSLEQAIENATIGGKKLSALLLAILNKRLLKSVS